MMVISHLVALSNNLVIGVNNDLPWKLKKDLQHFSLYTQNKAIVMGRKTFESIGRPLPNRKNIVISSTLDMQDGLMLFQVFRKQLKPPMNGTKKNSLDDEIII
jgi:dihydrofolate reductase